MGGGVGRFPVHAAPMPPVVVALLVVLAVNPAGHRPPNGVRVYRRVYLPGERVEHCSRLGYGSP